MLGIKNDESNGKVIEKAYMISPIWAGAFFVLGGIITIAMGILFWLFGFSSADDRVFAIVGLFGGIIAIQAMQKIFNKRFVLLPKISIPFIYIWMILCLYVFIFRPLE